MWEIVIKQPSPSLNRYMGAPFWVKTKDKRLWFLLIRNAIGLTEIPKATTKRRLTILRYGRLLDYDNLIGGAKCVITDNLKDMGLLVDDTDEWVELGGKCLKCGRGERPRTVLILEDM